MVVVLYFDIGNAGLVIVEADRDRLLCECCPEKRDVPVLVADRTLLARIQQKKSPKCQCGHSARHCNSLYSMFSVCHFKLSLM